MGSPRFAGLDKRMSAAAASPAVNTDDEPELPADDECKCADKENCTCQTKETPMAEETIEQPDAVVPVAPAAANEGAVDLNARLKAVAADERIKGREAGAIEMLADSEFDGLSAEAICKIVAKMPEADADGAAMLAAIVAGGNPDLGNAGGEKPSEQAEAKSMWDSAHAEIAEARAA